MRLSAKAALGLWMVCAGVLLAGEETARPPILNVPKLTQAAPKIDGILDDAAWKDAAKSEDFKRSFGAESNSPSHFWIMWDETNLYIALECIETEAAMKNLKALIEDHDADRIWDDDDVEFFFDPTGTRKYPYYQIILNPKGTTFDVQMRKHKDPDKSWEPKYESKVHLGTDRWTVELALPWTCFDRTEKSNATWTFNALHSRNVGEMLYWSPVYSAETHTPWRFGVLKGMPERDLKAK